MSNSSAMMGSSSSSSKSRSGSRGASDLEQDAQLLHSIREVRDLCRQFPNTCRDRLCHQAFDIHDPNRIEDWARGARTIPPTTHLSAFACTAACGKTTCVGCNRAPALNPTSLFSTLGVVNHCCDQGRLYAIYFLLGRFDEAQLQKKKPAEEKTKPKGKKGHHKLHKGSSIPGVGYASGNYDYGVGWGGVMVDELDEEDFHENFGSYAAAFQTQYGMGMPPTGALDDEDKINQDNLMIETLRLLSTCLPDVSSPAVIDRSLFRLSTFLDSIAELIRNDSISDVTGRAELYMEVIGFVKLITDIPSLAGLLFEERLEKSQSPGLRVLASPDLEEATFPVSYSTSASVFSGSKNIYQQVKMYLKLAAKTSSAAGSSQMPSHQVMKKETRRLCEGILELHEYMKARSDASQPSLIDDAKAVPSAGADAVWAAFQAENKVTFTEEVLTAHRFSAEALKFKTSVVKNRLSTISKEIATLTTSLPPGIFLKIAESRSDIMKVMIVGTEGTPYAGGLFIFDIFLPPEYPVTPPKMAFVLTGNDTDAYSFNPNLHAGGSVCLSILNTWSGLPQEMWQPNKSTLLAVLVSVQAMILGAPFPWHNEPGHEHDGESTQVIENKKVIQTKTIRHAMLAWIENPFFDEKAKEHIWGEISKTYWKHHGSKVLCEVNTWVADNPHLLEFSHHLGYPFGPKKSRSKATLPPGSSVNLINKLAVALGLTPPYEDEPEPVPEKKRSLLSKLRGKRKVSESDIIPHHIKKQKSEGSGSGDTSEHDQVWIYTGVVNQKEARAACKEFGIGAAASIKDTIVKLEKHVNNEKGKANPALMAKWGKLAYGYFEEDGSQVMTVPKSKFGPDVFGPSMDDMLTAAKPYHSKVGNDYASIMTTAPWAESP